MPDRTTRQPGPGSADHGSALVRAGAACFVLGLVAVAVIFGLFATGAHDLPLWLNLVAMLAPIGFGLALAGLFRQGRRPTVPTRSGSGTGATDAAAASGGGGIPK